jgi:hypothetical protein
VPHAFGSAEAQHLLSDTRCMTPATGRAKSTDGALRSAKEIDRDPSSIDTLPSL